MARLIERPEVQNELMLNGRQREAMNKDHEVHTALQAKLMNNEATHATQFQSPGNSEEKQQQAEELEVENKALREADASTLEKALDPLQIRRLRQLALQWEGPLALAEPLIADRAQLTSAHRAQVQKIKTAWLTRRTATEHNAQSMTRLQGGMYMAETLDLENPRSAVRKRLTALKSQAQRQIVAVLNQEELAHWRVLQGKPFVFRSNGQSDWRRDIY